MNNGTCQLTFPWDGVVPFADVVVLRDVDVVGVGSLRRRQLQELQKTKHLHLLTYGMQIPEDVSAIYQAEMLRTLSWLRPLKTEEGAPLDLAAEFRSLFARIFPLTQKSLGLAADRLRDEYLANMVWSSWLLQDHWRYFVGFLRQKFPGQSEILELAHWEWVRAWIETQPFSSEASEEGVLSLNPSLQVVILSVDNSLLQRKKGLYAFVYCEDLGSIEERPLDIVEALFIDLLQEDRKYSASQLVERATLSLQGKQPLSDVELNSKLLTLIAAEIIKAPSKSR